MLSRRQASLLFSIVALGSLGATFALCPLSLASGGRLPPGHPPVLAPLGPSRTAALSGYNDALQRVDFAAVKADIISLFTESKDYWPADYGTYAPFFIRLAWHCAGRPAVQPSCTKHAGPQYLCESSCAWRQARTVRATGGGAAKGRGSVSTQSGPGVRFSLFSCLVLAKLPVMSAQQPFYLCVYDRSLRNAWGLRPAQC